MALENVIGLYLSRLLCTQHSRMDAVRLQLEDPAPAPRQIYPSAEIDASLKALALGLLLLFSFCGDSLDGFLRGTQWPEMPLTRLLGSD